jgi:hypothetical protein
MLNILSRIELDYPADRLGGSEDRLNILRRQIAFYRQNLRQTLDKEFAAIYAREIVRAECELAGLMKGGLTPSGAKKPNSSKAAHLVGIL